MKPDLWDGKGVFQFVGFEFQANQVFGHDEWLKRHKNAAAGARPSPLDNSLWFSQGNTALSKSIRP